MWFEVKSFVDDSGQRNVRELIPMDKAAARAYVGQMSRPVRTPDGRTAMASTPTFPIQATTIEEAFEGFDLAMAAYAKAAQSTIAIASASALPGANHKPLAIARPN